ncbi:chalcone isomerase [Nitzschia inconspicua]|uniref:Chalcone isomerase n=1 Tax=Nitzschia inconspicua TaxID=303405 RepID=A0A9K3LH21_9STRA|nr:chalcone isomerase-like protein [Nitzschia inconspicua]KAG7362284.1 chalcone isomerase [Nitzschia inconspicua]
MLVASSRRALVAVANRPSMMAARSYVTHRAGVATRHSHRVGAAAAALGVLAVSVVVINEQDSPIAMCAARIPAVGEILSIGKITTEPATGIKFPELCNGMALAGVGVRIKYVFVKVYGVGAYFDPIAMMAVKRNPSEIENALLDPTYPRTLRIVMNRGLGVDKFISAIVEAVEPRLKGKNLETLDEFKAIFPKVDLVEGDEIEMTIRGDSLLLKTALNVGTIQSRAFTEAMCDVYFGSDPVSPTLKEDVVKGISNF